MLETILASSGKKPWEKTGGQEAVRMAVHRAVDRGLAGAGWGVGRVQGRIKERDGRGTKREGVLYAAEVKARYLQFALIGASF